MTINSKTLRNLLAPTTYTWRPPRSPGEPSQPIHDIAIRV
jgi:hypothetical protein